MQSIPFAVVAMLAAPFGASAQDSLEDSSSFTGEAVPDAPRPSSWNEPSAVNPAPPSSPVDEFDDDTYVVQELEDVQIRRRVSRRHDVEEVPEEPHTRRFLHGFRLGYNFTFNINDPQCEDCESLAEEYDLRSPHSFLLGYEVAYRMIGNSWLNLLLVANASVTGLEQSKFLPSGNLLLGFEFNQSFQVGLGMNLAPDESKVAHMIAAAGWTPRVGNFYTPVHFYFVPDVDGNHRMGATFGVTW